MLTCRRRGNRRKRLRACTPVRNALTTYHVVNISPSVSAPLKQLRTCVSRLITPRAGAALLLSTPNHSLSRFALPENRVASSPIDPEPRLLWPFVHLAASAVDRTDAAS
jgi:hypothetical protein